MTGADRTPFAIASAALGLTLALLLFWTSTCSCGWMLPAWRARCGTAARRSAFRRKCRPSVLRDERASHALPAVSAVRHRALPLGAVAGAVGRSRTG
jgi:hypothetical protein